MTMRVENMTARLNRIAALLACSRTGRTPSGVNDGNISRLLLTKVTSPVVGATKKAHVDAR